MFFVAASAAAIGSSSRIFSLSQNFAQSSGFDHLVGFAFGRFIKRQQFFGKAVERVLARREDDGLSGFVRQHSRRNRGSKPAWTTEDLPLPDGPTTATSG